MSCCRVRTLSTNYVRCVWLAPVLDATMHAESPFNRLKAALQASGSNVQGTDSLYSPLTEGGLEQLLVDRQGLAHFIGCVFKVSSAGSPDGTPIPENSLAAMAANVIAILARGRWVVAVFVHSASLTQSARSVRCGHLTSRSTWYVQLVARGCGASCCGYGDPTTHRIPHTSPCALPCAGGHARACSLSPFVVLFATNHPRRFP